MLKSIEDLLFKVGFKSKKEQRIVLVIATVIFVYCLGYSIGTFVSHIQNNGISF